MSCLRRNLYGYSSDPRSICTDLGRNLSVSTHCFSNTYRHEKDQITSENTQDHCLHSSRIRHCPRIFRDRCLARMVCDRIKSERTFVHFCMLVGACVFLGHQEFSMRKISLAAERAVIIFPLYTDSMTGLPMAFIEALPPYAGKLQHISIAYGV